MKTYKTARKGSNKVISLKDFYDQVPGSVPAENCLPSKPMWRSDEQDGREIEDANHFMQTSLRPGGGTSPWSSPKTIVSPPEPESSSQPPTPRGAAGLAPGAAGYRNSFPNSNPKEGGSWGSSPQSHGPLGNHLPAGPRVPSPPADQQPKQWGPSIPQPQKKQANTQTVVPAHAGNMLHMVVPKRAQAPLNNDHSKAQSNGWSGGPSTPVSEGLTAGEGINTSGSLKSVTPALVKSAGPDKRPVLNIDPRTRPAQEGPPSPPGHEVRPADDEQYSRARPKLNLKPRSIVVEADLPTPTPHRSTSVFGDAIPREVVLSNRGEPLPKANLDRTVSAPALAKPAQSERWHKVQPRKKAAPFKAGLLQRINVAHPVHVDPFFSDYIPSHKSFSAFVGDAEAYEVPEVERRRSDDSSAAISKRALPLRGDDDLLF